MIRKICPVCDQEMQGQHYCRYCRSWVRTPVTRNITYRLNEPNSNRNNADIDNSTMQSLMKRSPEKADGWKSRQPRTGQAASQLPKPRSQAGQAARQQPGQQLRPSAGAGKNQAGTPVYKPAKRQSSAGGFVVTLIIILFIFSIILVNIMNAGIVGVYTMETADEIIDLGPYTDAVYEDSAYWDRDEEELRDAGESCNLLGHFLITAEELEADLFGLFEEYDLVFYSSAMDSINREYENGGTWFSTWKNYYVKESEDDDTQFYVCLDSDTATGALHEVYGTLRECEQAINITMDLLQIFEERGEFGTDLADAGITAEIMKESMDSENYYRAYHEGIEIRIDAYDENNLDVYGFLYFSRYTKIIKQVL